MSRIQLALNVSDLDAAIDFYSSLFATPPHKRRPGYANFAIEDPPLKLVLLEHAGADARLNHLGVEVGTSAEVTAAADALASAGLATDVRSDEVCCFAAQDKVWVADPDGAPWEVYTITDDAPTLAAAEASTCCAPAAEGVAACC